jgi:hypothetical protein
MMIDLASSAATTQWPNIGIDSFSAVRTEYLAHITECSYLGLAGFYTCILLGQSNWLSIKQLVGPEPFRPLW